MQVVLKVAPEKLATVKPEAPKRPRKKPKVAAAKPAVARALDKSGEPCRRWTKEPRAITSFTGYSINTESWRSG